MAGVQIDGVNNKIDFDDDLDTSISANVDDTLVFEIAGATDFTMTANTFTAASGSDVVLTGTSTGAEHKAFWDSSNNSLDFGDSTQLRFGASADLKVYHDGTNSYIVDSGTGNLKISAADLQIMNAASSELMIQGIQDGAVTLYHNNIAKLATTATGIEVTGRGTFTNTDQTDTLTLSNTDADANVGPRLKFGRNSSSPADGDLTGDIRFETKNDAGQDVVAAQIKTNIGDVRDGLEFGEMNFHAMVNGTLTEFIALSSNVAPAIVFNEQSADIDFRVESDNDANAFFVQGSDGHVGLGHSAPDVELHLKQTNNHPTIKFENTKTATDSGDFLGHILFHGNDGTSGASGDRAFIKASVDNTSGATSLQLGTSNSGAAVAEAMRILGNGNVAIGGTSADSRTEITMPTAGDHYASFMKHSAGSGVVRILRHQFTGYAPDDNTSRFFSAGDTSATRIDIHADGDVKNHDNSYGAISDERIKSNITDANSQWDDLKAIKVRNFERKDDITQYGAGNKVQIGVVAQEVESVSPGLVKERDPGVDDIKMSSEFGTLYEDGDTIPEGKKVGDIKTTTDEKVKGVSYSVLYMKAIKALQEAQTRIETLETKVAALEG